ncbi:MAG: helix-turn-helix transcriptional regulator [Actinomycetota bacterium]
MTADGTAEWISPEGLAVWLGVPRSTIYEWRLKGTGPAGVKVGKHVRFRRAEVERWLAERAHEERARAGTS